MVAAGLLVELLASLVQHPLGHRAPTRLNTAADERHEELSCLGIVPHQIRGYVNRFQQVCLQKS